MADGISALQRILQQAAVRHGVLASNIANVDTPGYQARDVSFGQVLGNELALAATDVKHLPLADNGAAGTIRTNDATPWPDKNNVEMDLEIAKMTENGMLYEAGVTLLEKKIGMFKSALKTS